MIDPNFILIDLRGQRTALEQYVAGWSTDEILVWLRRYGEVISRKYDGYTIYYFRSACDLYADFRFTETGDLFIPG